MKAPCPGELQGTATHLHPAHFIISILHSSKLRCVEIKGLDKGHAVSTGLSQDANSDRSDEALYGHTGPSQ